MGQPIRGDVADGRHHCRCYLRSLEYCWFAKPAGHLESITQQQDAAAVSARTLLGWTEECKHPGVPVHYLHLPHTVPYSVDNMRSAALLSRHLQSTAKLYVSWGSRIVTVLAAVTVVTYGPEFRACVSALCRCLSEYRLTKRWRWE